MCKWKKCMKRSIALLLAGVLTISGMDVTAFATETKDDRVLSDIIDMGEYSIESFGDISLIGDEDGIVELKEGNYEKWIDRIDIPQYGIDFYNDLIEWTDNDGIDDYLISDEAFAKNSSTYSQLSFKSGKANLNSVKTATVTSDINSNTDYISKVIRAAFDAFLMDHPEVFWLTGSNMGYYYSRNIGNNIVEYEFYYILKIHDDSEVAPFDMRNEAYQSENLIKDDILIRENAINTILNTDAVVNAKNDYEIVKAFNEWLTKNNEYNTLVSSEQDSSGPDYAHICLSALTGNEGEMGPVCESYAEAFKLLCERKNIPCVVVTGPATSRPGSAGESHAWNLVKVDGYWYAMDVTWNDPAVSGRNGKVSGYENENYLLVGSETVHGELKFQESHRTQNTASDKDPVAFLNGPLMSETAYSNNIVPETPTYTIKWDVDGDGTADDTATYTYGETPSHADGVKPADTQYTYTFTGWSPSITSVTGDKTYTAQFVKKEISEEPEIPDVPDVTGVIRVAGKNRYETSLMVAETYKTVLGVERFKTAIVATGNQFADALPGSYLAYMKKAPILLTNTKDKYMNNVVDYVVNNVEKGAIVYILGGESAVSKAMDSKLITAGFNPVRLGGKNRYETNVKILEAAGVTGGEIIVATGEDFADSLSASATKKPILLVKNKFYDFQEKFLSGLKDCKFYIVGGTAAVSMDTVGKLLNYGTIEARIAGTGRRETSVLIAKKFFDNPSATAIAYEKEFPDGLCGGPLAAELNIPLLLTREGKTSEASAYVQEFGIKSGYVLGGNEAMTDKAVMDVYSLKSEDKIK